jgi:hypothetical protein
MKKMLLALALLTCTAAPLAAQPAPSQERTAVFHLTTSHQLYCGGISHYVRIYESGDGARVAHIPFPYHLAPQYAVVRYRPAPPRTQRYHVRTCSGVERDVDVVLTAEVVDLRGFDDERSARAAARR